MRITLTALSIASAILPPPVAGLTYHGADFSSLTLLTNSGQKYWDSSISSSATPFETILARHGVNLARIRVWVNTNDNDYSLNYGLALAKKAQAAGMQILVDLHYSSTCEASGLVRCSWRAQVSIFQGQTRVINLSQPVGQRLCLVSIHRSTRTSKRLVLATPVHLTDS